MDIAAIAELCAPNVAPGTLQRIAAVESSFNPWAIGVVGARLARQPRNRDEALATARALAAAGYDFSIGLVQVNQKNFGRYGISAEEAFDPCTNLRVGGLILEDCYRRAGGQRQQLGDALSCYYSGNFTTGYQDGYVAEVSAMPSSGAGVLPIALIPGKRKPKADVNASAPSAAPERLFVSTPPAPVIPAVQGDVPSPTNAVQTALLF